MVQKPVLLIAAICAVTAQGLLAATYTWKQSAGAASPGTDYNWSTGANWDIVGAPPAAGAADAIVNFRPNGLTMTGITNSINDLPGDFALNRLSVGNNEWGGSTYNQTIAIRGNPFAFYGSNATLAFNINYGISYTMANDLNFTTGSTTTISVAGANPGGITLNSAWVGSGAVVVTPQNATATFIRRHSAASTFSGAVSVTQGIYQYNDAGVAGSAPTAQTLTLGNSVTLAAGTTLRLYRGDNVAQDNTYTVGANLVAASGGTVNLSRSGANGFSQYNMGTLALGTAGQATTLTVNNSNYYNGGGRMAFTGSTISGDATLDVTGASGIYGTVTIANLGPTTLNDQSSLTLKLKHNATDNWWSGRVAMGLTTVNGTSSLILANTGASNGQTFTLPRLTGNGTFTVDNQGTWAMAHNATPSTGFTGTFRLIGGTINDSTATAGANPALSTNLIVGGTGVYNLNRINGLGTDATKTVTISTGGTFRLNADSTSSYSPADIPQKVVLGGGTIATDAQGDNQYYAADVGAVTVSADSTANVLGYLNFPSLTGTGKLTKLGSGTGQKGTLRIAGASPSYSGTIEVLQGILRLDNADSLGTGSIIIDPVLPAGAINLNFAGTDVVTAVTLGGTTYTSGTFGAIGSGATYQNAVFTGTGLLVVPEPAVVGVALVTALGALWQRRRQA